MTTTGRNDPCPCGSGRKYKRCCLAQDDEDQNRRRSLVEEVLAAEEHHHDHEEHHHACAECGGPTDDIPDRLYRAIEQRAHAGNLDEAQVLCDELRRRYPNDTEWMDRQAHICAERGDHAAAADLFRRCLALATSRGGYAPDYLDYLADRIRHLEHDHLAGDRHPGDAVT
jgi:predicted Zn-dependent protease